MIANFFAPLLWQHAVGNRRISYLSLLHSDKFICFLCFTSWIFKLYLPWCLCQFILGMKLSCNMWLHPVLSPFSFNPLLSLFVFDCSALRGVSRRAWAGRSTAWRTRWTSWGRATTATPGTSRWSWTARRRRRWWGSSCAGAGWDQEQAVSLPIGGGGHRRNASRTGEMTSSQITYIYLEPHLEAAIQHSFDDYSLLPESKPDSHESRVRDESEQCWSWIRGSNHPWAGL